MSQFASHLLSRHLEPEKSLKPRVRGRFEPVSLAPTIFTANDYREASTDDSFRQPVANEIIQPEKENLFYPGLRSNQTTAPETAMRMEKANEETTPSRNNPFPLPNSSLVEKRTNQHDITEKAPAGHSPLPGLQPAGVIPIADEKKGQSQTPENPFVKNNRENQTAVASTLKGFADRHIAATQSDFSAETVQPALQKNNTVSSESNPKGITETFRSQPSSRYFNLPPVHHPGETNQPVVKVTIGRIEVRAVVQAASSPARSTAAAKPKLSLEDYLKQRNNKMT